MNAPQPERSISREARGPERRRKGCSPELGRDAWHPERSEGPASFRLRWSALATLLTLFVVASPLSALLSAQALSDHALPQNPPTSRDTLIPAAQRKPAPNFTLIDSNGKPFTLAHTRGQVVILNFWATWCGGCKFELPYFVGYDGKYRAAGLTTLGVSMDDGGFPVVKPFWTKQAMPYPTVIGNDALAKQLGLTGMPFTVLLDRRGRVALTHAGVLDREDFDHHIQQLLAHQEP